MFKICNGNITLTRGDSACFTCRIVDQSGADYELQDGDDLLFTVRQNSASEKKEIALHADGSGTFDIEPQHTSEMQFGSYWFDVQLTTADGSVYTVVPPHNFIVAEEISW